MRTINVVLMMFALSFSVTAQIAINGKINVNQMRTDAPYFATEDYLSEQVTISAVPDDGFEFDQWLRFTRNAIFESNAEWYFSDDGMQKPEDWMQPNYDYLDWSIGSGVFGYNNGNEQTIVDFGTSSQNKHVTTYFRKDVFVESPSDYQLIKLLVDDGAVVYVNGEEVLRVNMPEGVVDHLTLATSNIPDERTYKRFIIDGAFQQGANTIAVEIHQSSRASSDLSFDLSLDHLTPDGNSLSVDWNSASLILETDFSMFLVPLFSELEIDSTRFMIQMTELVSDNQTGILDAYGQNSDWIEIYNSGQEQINLNEFYLSDKANNIWKWQFPDTLISPQDRYVVFASDDAPIFEELHANFKISKSGEPIYLSFNGEIVQSIPSTSLAPDQGLVFSNLVWQKSFVLTPGAANPNISTVVEFSRDAGLYTESFDLTLTGGDEGQQIRFTTDGSDPVAQSRIYTAPITIEDKTSTANGIESIATSGEWGLPVGDVRKGMVIKAALFQGVTRIGEIETNTYLIHQDFPTQQGFPILSISVHPDSLFGEEGIYVLGPDALEDHPHLNANFWKGIERKCHLEFFEIDGQVAFEQPLGVKIFGGYSKGYPQKSLRLTARDLYGPKRIYHQVFPEKDLIEFKSIVLRNSGQDINRSFMRDAVSQDLNQTANLPMQSYRPSVVYINGVFWGVHNVRERLDDHHLSITEDVDKSSIDLLEINGTVSSGDNSDYFELMDYLRDNDMSLDEAYDFVKAQMDIDNFTDYMITQIYVNNKDWPHGNIRYWRSSELDNKWRWIMYDLDPGMGGWGGDASSDNLARALSIDGNGHGDWSTFIFRSLVQNEAFKNQFINKFLDKLNGQLSFDQVRDKVDAYKSFLEPMMPDHIDRWPTSITSMLAWTYGVNPIKTFGEHRKIHQIDHLISNFEFSNGTYELDVKIQDKLKGYVQLNSLTIREGDFQGTYLTDVPVTISAIPSPGYRFVGWDGIDRSSQFIQATFDSSISITPIFEENRNLDYAGLTINEVYNKSEFPLRKMDSVEWIELYNGSEESMDLSGLYLTDNDNEARWNFPFESPASTTLDPGMFLIVYADDDAEYDDYEGLKANFNKLQSDDMIRLSKIVGENVTIIDSLLVFSKGLSHGQFPDGGEETMSFSVPTPYLSNTTNLDCNNEEFGTAMLDACGVCSGGNTGLIADLCLNVGMDEFSSSEMTIFPNPVSSVLSLSETVHWRLLNPQGEFLKEGFSDRVSVTNLKSGIYFLNTTEGVLRFVKL